MFLTELLAAIPSIVYGLWGIFVLVPLVRQFEVAHCRTRSRAHPALQRPAARRRACSRRRSILAIMVIPFTSSVAREVLKAVPQAQREGAYALGATRWEAIRAALFYARTGIIGAVMLGFGRALGETMAVTMVIGNNPQITTSLFAPQYTMAAVIANEFTEAADDLHLQPSSRSASCSSSSRSAINVAVAPAHLAHDRAGALAPAPRRATPPPERRHDPRHRLAPPGVSHAIVVAVRRGGRCSRWCRSRSSSSSSCDRGSAR